MKCKEKLHGWIVFLHSLPGRNIRVFTIFCGFRYMLAMNKERNRYTILVKAELDKKIDTPSV